MTAQDKPRFAFGVSATITANKEAAWRASPAQRCGRRPTDTPQATSALTRSATGSASV